MGKLLVIFFSTLSFIFVSSCDKKKKDNPRVSVYGGSVAVGTALISPECGSSAQVSIYMQNSNYQYGSNYNNGSYTINVVNGGTYEFQLSPGTYIIQGTSTSAYNTSGCQYANVVYSAANNNVTANVCIGSSVQNHCPVNTYNTYNQNTYYQQYPYGTNYNPYLTQGPNCMWGTYGCMGYTYPGTGTVGVGKPNLYFYVNKPTKIKLDLEFKDGSNVTAAVPGLGQAGWDVEVQADGKIKSLADNTVWDYLFYEGQVHHKDLQMSKAFKVKRDEAAKAMANYLNQEGFNDRTIKDFEYHQTTNKMPPNEEYYIYPQNNSHIDPIVQYKTTSKLVQKKIWFLIVPVLTDAQLKLKKTPTFFASAFDTKKVQTIAVNKNTGKQRQLANSDDILVEEWGVGYLLEK